MGLRRFPDWRGGSNAEACRLDRYDNKQNDAPWAYAASPIGGEVQTWKLSIEIVWDCRLEIKKIPVHIATNVYGDKYCLFFKRYASDYYSFDRSIGGRSSAV